MEKRKNCWVIPTDKPSRLYLSNYGKELNLSGYPLRNYTTGQNIYITSDEEKIKERDWHYNLALNCVEKTTKFDNGLLQEKIILTTDLELQKDGVQAIDDEFLEWFVKNPSCEEVEVNFIEDNWGYYEIIIPKEEPKQETLEEAAERTYREYPTNPIDKPEWNYNIDINCFRKRKAFINGAKWQAERMYSEDDIKQAFEDGKENIDYSDTYGWSSKLTKEEWFEQFKKKIRYDSSRMVSIRKTK